MTFDKKLIKQLEILFQRGYIYNRTIESDRVLIWFTGWEYESYTSCHTNKELESFINSEIKEITELNDDFGGWDEYESILQALKTA